MQYNQVMVSARVTKDIEVKDVGQTQVVNLSVAINRSYKVKGKNELQQETVFIEIVAWGKLAQDCGHLLAKGSEIFVIGKLKQQSWEDKNTHEKKSKIVIEASKIIPLDGSDTSTEEA
jgi:single-strand DNA-binding protein